MGHCCGQLGLDPSDPLRDYVEHKIHSPRHKEAGMFSLESQPSLIKGHFWGINTWPFQPVMCLDWSHACCRRTAPGREGRDRKLWVCMNYCRQFWSRPERFDGPHGVYNNDWHPNTLTTVADTVLNTSHILTHLILTTLEAGTYYYPHFKKEKIELPRGYIIFLKSYGLRGDRARFQDGCPNHRAPNYQTLRVVSKLNLAFQRNLPSQAQTYCIFCFNRGLVFWSLNSSFWTIYTALPIRPLSLQSEWKRGALPLQR